MAELYTQSELEARALNFIRRNRPEAKTMSRQEIAEWAALKAGAARREAQNLMYSGVWEQEAWNRAIRSEILESDSD